MDPVDAGRGGVAAPGGAAPQLLAAAAALRWARPDLTATLAELVLDAATEPRTWAAAAGWSLYGRAAVGDGRETAADLLDRLDRWGADAPALMAGPDGRRLRLELAGPAHHIGEPGVVRALLSGGPADEADPELRADLLTGLARCAVDDAPEAADDALKAAEQAWQALDCGPGVASVMLLDASRHRRAARPGLASVLAAAGLKRVDVEGRRAEMTRSDHVAAALAAEWIAALVEDGRVDEARSEAMPTAERLLALARPSRQTAKLRLAVARVSAVAESPEVVVAALEPAARDAADSDRPELESACRSMLGELHEAAGRLDAALGSVRAAMAAERSDRERTTRLRSRLAAAVAGWTTKTQRATSAPAPSGEPVAAGPRERQAESRGSRIGWPGTDDVRADGGRNGHAVAAPVHDGRHRSDGAGDGDLFAGRETVGPAAERSGSPATDGGGVRSDGRSRRTDAVVATSRMESPERTAEPSEWVPAGGSLIGDALMRELAGGPLPRRDTPARRDAALEAGRDPGGRYPDAVPSGGPPPDARSAPDGHPAPQHDSLFRPAGDGPPPSRHRRDGGEAPTGGQPSSARAGADGLRLPPWSAEPGWTERPSSIGDTVVLGRQTGDSSSSHGHDDRGDGPDHGADGADGSPPARHGGPRYPDDARRSDRNSADGARPAGPGDTVRYDRARDADGHRAVGGPPGSSTGDHPHGPEAGDRPDGPLPPGAGGEASTGPQRRRAPGSASADAEGLGMGDLLAGALAAYRNM
jgi:syndecan 1